MRANVEEMSAREIKDKLIAARVDFSDCFEKSDLVRRLRNHQKAENDDKGMRERGINIYGVVY
jgi:hypothetical protein